jgi:hypothetical protein
MTQRTAIRRRAWRWRALSAALAVAFMGGMVSLAPAPAAAEVDCDNLPNGTWLGSWTSTNIPNLGGLLKVTYNFDGPGVTGTAEFVTGTDVVLAGSEVEGTQDGCDFEMPGEPSAEGTVQGDGVTILGTWSYLGIAEGTWRAGLVSVSATGDGIATTDGGGGPNSGAPIATTVESPNAGTITIDQAISSGGTSPGFTLLDTFVGITAPPASPEDPLVLTFDIDGSQTTGVDLDTLTVVRNGAGAGDCPGATQAAPDPCVSDRELLGGGRIRLTVLTSQASVWAFGVPIGGDPPPVDPPAPLGFRVVTTTLPEAALGRPYSTALAAAGGSAPYKWKKLSKLPKGLELRAKTGVISGTPKRTGTFSLSVEVRYKTKAKHQRAVWHTATEVLSLHVRA